MSNREFHVYRPARRGTIGDEIARLRTDADANLGNPPADRRRVDQALTRVADDILRLEKQLADTQRERDFLTNLPEEPFIATDDTTVAYVSYAPVDATGPVRDGRVMLGIRIGQVDPRNHWSVVTPYGDHDRQGSGMWPSWENVIPGLYIPGYTLTIYTVNEYGTHYQQES